MRVPARAWLSFYVIGEGQETSPLWSLIYFIMIYLRFGYAVLFDAYELVELVVALLPEVQYAVEQGITDQTALDMPGIRALACHRGSSRAVSAAQKVVGLLLCVFADKNGLLISENTLMYWPSPLKPLT